MSLAMDMLTVFWGLDLGWQYLAIDVTTVKGTLTTM